MNTRITKLFIFVLTLCALLGGSARINAQTQLTVDTNQNWIGYMNVSALPAAGGAFQFGQAWTNSMLQGGFSGTSLILAPCVSVWETNDDFYVQADGQTPNEIMDANFYVQNDALINTNIAFSGTCTSDTLTTQPEPLTGVSYTSVAFIKMFNSGFGLLNSVTSNLVTGQPFSISLNTTGAAHVQYGFETIGPDANPATVSSLGHVVVAVNTLIAPPPTPTNNAPTPTNSAASVLAMYDSSGVYPEVPVQDWLASWSSAAEAPFTIPNATNVVLKYTTLSYAGVEFGPPDQINASAYNTLHIDLWTPAANQFGVQLVSLDNLPGNTTQAAQVNFTPASGKIVTNKWVSLNIPLNQFTSVNSTLDLSDLQQLLWIDNQGGGVTSSTFFIDNVYFFSNAVVPPPIPTPTNNAPIPTQAANAVLAMYDSSGVYPETPVDDWRASWSGSSGGPFTITNTGNVVLQYGGMSYAGAEFYNQDGINVSSYNTMHVDVWTPNANQFGIQLVSLDNSATQAGQVNFLPASGVILSNRWVGLDIPLSTFSANPVAGESGPLDFTDLQQLLWIDNQAGGGVTGGIFYVDNVYFYTSSIVISQPTLSVSLSGANVNLSFATQSGASYSVWYKTNLTDATWQTLSTIPGTGSTQTVQDTSNKTSRFYILSIH